MRVTVDMGGALAHIEAMRAAALFAASSQALTDSNLYVPVREWHLHNSAETASDLERGRLVWQTPYAQRRYYEPANLSHYPNPRASLKWALVAKQNHLEDWRQSAEKAMGDV